VEDADHKVLVVDKLTYAGNLAHLLRRKAILSTSLPVAALISVIACYFYYLAAESRDRSIDGPAEFINANVVGIMSCSRLRSRMTREWRRSKEFRFPRVERGGTLPARLPIETGRRGIPYVEQDENGSTVRVWS
jgi:dTDP-D-glucose 4,6-dehydratase